MEKLKKAEAELAFKKAEYEKKRKLVEDLRIEKLLPKAVKEYEGKYFKEVNSYGYGSDKGDWFMYYFVKKVTSHNYCEAIMIQLEPYGSLELQNDRHLPLSLCKNEITKEDFLSAVGSLEKHFVDTMELCR